MTTIVGVAIGSLLIRRRASKPEDSQQEKSNSTDERVTGAMDVPDVCKNPMLTFLVDTDKPTATKSALQPSNEVQALDASAPTPVQGDGFLSFIPPPPEAEETHGKLTMMHILSRLWLISLHTGVPAALSVLEVLPPADLAQSFALRLFCLSSLCQY